MNLTPAQEAKAREIADALRQNTDDFWEDRIDYHTHGRRNGALWRQAETAGRAILDATTNLVNGRPIAY